MHFYSRGKRTDWVVSLTWACTSFARQKEKMNLYLQKRKKRRTTLGSTSKQNIFAVVASVLPSALIDLTVITVLTVMLDYIY